MTEKEIQQQLNRYAINGKKMFVTSSFQTHSIPLLHIISTSGVDMDVLFINTGFHFPETLHFRDEITASLNLNMIDVRPSTPKVQQRDTQGNFYFISEPDYCCHMNKIQPLEPYLIKYDIWVNGVRADQSATRKAMQMEQDAPHGSMRFHPMLEWNAKRIYEYRIKHQLPEHPLDAQGYQSIGCVPCTRKMDFSDERSARWFGMNKTECGLHTELISKKIDK